jgi:choline dehydrogenase-like flavoprotein
MGQQDFEYVVVGAGSAGCVLAARLTEGGKKTVCLIEAGGFERTDPRARRRRCEGSDKDQQLRLRDR